MQAFDHLYNENHLHAANQKTHFLKHPQPPLRNKPQKLKHIQLKLSTAVMSAKNGTVTISS